MAEHRHKRDTDARRLFGVVTSTKTKVSAGLAALATTERGHCRVLRAPDQHGPAGRRRDRRPDALLAVIDLLGLC